MKELYQNRGSIILPSPGNSSGLASRIPEYKPQNEKQRILSGRKDNRQGLPPRDPREQKLQEQ